MGNSKDSVRKKAEAFYIENIGTTQTDVAELFKVAFSTVNNWCNKYQWDDQRLSYHASPTKIKQLLQKELLSIANGNPPKLPADAISKLMSALEKFDKSTDPNVVARVLIDLDIFTSEQIDPKTAFAQTAIHRKFLIHRIALESKH